MFCNSVKFKYYCIPLKSTSGSSETNQPCIVFDAYIDLFVWHGFILIDSFPRTGKVCFCYYTSVNNFKQCRAEKSCGKMILLTLKVLVATIDAQWEGMGDVGSARYEPALLRPCPTIRVLSYSN